MYSIIKDNNEHNTVAKGIKKITTKTDVKHEDYKKTLVNNKQVYHTMKTIRSDHHQLGSYELNIHCHASMIRDSFMIIVIIYAYGHYKI